MAEKYGSFIVTFPESLLVTITTIETLRKFDNNVSLRNRITSSQELFNETSRRHQTEVKEI